MSYGTHSVGTVAVGVLPDTPSGGGGGGNTFTKTLTGSLTASGVAPKRSRAVPRASSVTIAGSLGVSFRLGKAVAGSLSPSGAIRRKASRTLVGSIAAAGAARKRTLRTLQGSLSVFAFIGRRTRRRLTGTLTLAASLARGMRVPKALAGALTAAGSVVGSKLIFTTTLATQGAKALYSMLSRR